MQVPLLILAGLLGAQATPSVPAMQVYGFATRVKVEPGLDKPERLQLWGTFSVAASGAPDAYQAPELGYLYFQLPTNDRTAVAEWLELKRDVDAGTPVINRVGATIRGVLAFGRPGTRIRVRTADETPENPDIYGSGNGVAVVSYDNASSAVRQLGQLPLTTDLLNYALIDRVLVEPDEEQPERIQVWGVFVFARPDGSFAAPQRGYLYFRLPDQGPAYLPARQQEYAWKDLAGNHQVSTFYLSSADNSADLRVRPPEETPNTPDGYRRLLKHDSTIRSDTEYRPIRSLLDLR